MAKKTHVKVLRGKFVSRVTIIEPTKSKGGIIIPEGIDIEKHKDFYEEHPFQGEVLYVGEGYNDYPMQIKVGDKVYLTPGSGISVVIDKEYMMLFNESDVLCIV